MMTGSVGDLLDDWFETDALKGAYASSGVVGVWAGPHTPGTAYNLLHHALGELDGVQGAWGHVRGGMGAISTLSHAAPGRRAPTIRTGAPCRVHRCRQRSRHGRHTVSGETMQAPLVSRARIRSDDARPRRRRALPRRRGRRHAPLPHARGLGEDQLGPLGAAALRTRPPRRTSSCCTPAWRSAPSMAYLERAWQDATLGRPAEGPYIEVEVPTSIDPRLDRRRQHRDDDVHAVRARTPRPTGRRGRARPTAQHCLDLLGQYAPNVRTRSSITRCSPRRISSRSSASSAARSSRASRASTRWRSCALAGARALRHAGGRAVPVRRGDASRRRRDRRIRAQRRTAGAARPARRSLPDAHAPSRRGGPQLNGHSVQRDRSGRADVRVQT